MTKYSLGDIVLSKAGRDANEYFVVIGIIDDNYVYLADGKNKTLAKPKRKKTKHIKLCLEKSTLCDKLENARYLLDSDIRKVLKNFKNQTK